VTRPRLPFRRFGRDETGTSTVEFVILFPMFMTIFFAAFESGYMMIRNVMLERAVDLAVRDLRLGTPAPPNPQEFRDAVCENTYFIQDCQQVVRVQLEPVNMTTWAPIPGPPDCRNYNLSSQTPPTYLTGGNNELMMVRVCAMFQPMFPTTGLGLDMQYLGSGGNYAIVVTSAYVNEPSR
jgi:Flp pilus assembly protein TadG